MVGMSPCTRVSVWHRRGRAPDDIDVGSDVYAGTYRYAADVGTAARHVLGSVVNKTEPIGRLQLQEVAIPHLGGLRWVRAKEVEVAERSRLWNVRTIHQPRRMVAHGVVEEHRASRSAAQNPADPAIVCLIAVGVLCDRIAVGRDRADVAHIEESGEAPGRGQPRLLVGVERIAEHERVVRLVVSPGVALCRRNGAGDKSAGSNRGRSEHPEFHHGYSFLG